MFFESGKIQKLYIIAFTDDQYKHEVIVDGANKFEVQINPETISRKFGIDYYDSEASGATGSTAKLWRQKEQTLTMDFVFDATGVVKDAGLLNIAIANPFATQNNDVSSLISTFKKFCYDVNPSTHRAQFVKICYGSMDANDPVFKGVLQTLDIDYKLFSADGKPLRAIAHVTFRSSINPVDDALAKGLESPDITHQRTYTEGTHFTLLSNNIYNDVNRYIDVAKANRMLSFRKIETGTVINFPPIK